MFLLLLHLWNGRAWLVHSDMRAIFVFEKVPRILVEKTSLGHFKRRLLWAMNKNPFPYWLLYVTIWYFCTNKSASMLAIPFGLYQTRFEYPVHSPIMLVYVTPTLQWTCRYCPSGASMMFARYFLWTKALHVDWLSRRHQFSSIPDSSASARMLSPTYIKL